MGTISVKALSLIICITLLALNTVKTTATVAADEKECTEKLVACVPFVSGAAKQPTRECCDAKPKCLCVLIKEMSNHLSMGLPTNATSLALQVSEACKFDAKVSDCPSILNLPEDSDDAKIFNVAIADSTTTPSDSPASFSSLTATASDDAKENLLWGSSGAKTATTVLRVMVFMSVFLIFI